MSFTQSEEGLVEVDGVAYYAIPDVDRVPPFLMSMVSDGDRWMFVSSTGTLTAGRVDSSQALFPYETDDRMHNAAGSVGPVTVLRVNSGRGDATWRPFSAAIDIDARRTLAKSVVGDEVAFEERHAGLELTFRYRWNTAAEHGFVRTARLVNEGGEPVRIEVLDGLLGLLPHGLDPTVHQRLSNLSHAYKRSEVVDADTRLAVFSLEAPVSDSADPVEVLRATAVWSGGLEGANVTLHPAAVDNFEAGREDQFETLVTGRPGAYLLRSDLELGPGESVEWQVVADVALDQFEVAQVAADLRSETDHVSAIGAAVRSGRDGLVAIMALADAGQSTGDPVACAHHVANVTYNVMRGGVPLDGYRIDTGDFAAFVAERNQQIAERHAGWLRALPETLERRDLLGQVETVDDLHLSRLAGEYLPFSFSRRHGDPSRPWNAFSIQTHDQAGDPIIRYEGNWRDVFQNWEALCASFPEYLPAVIATFVNASTADGHNPYRITRSGIDWEVPDPDDPWSNIGYWGDHQIVYLLRLLEAADRFLPGQVAAMLGERRFTYADVPYRIATYDDLLSDPKATITFDHGANALSEERAADIGGDGRLLPGPDGELAVATLLEKLLVAALAKLGNFVPGGGIWMNTQRPEWNDANNALVGYGLSVVTLIHLRDFLRHLRHTVASDSGEAVVSVEVVAWLDRVCAALAEMPARPADGDVERHRMEMMDRLGQAASDYRSAIYVGGFTGETATVGADMVRRFCDLATAHLDVTIGDSVRSDGLVHSYNLISLSADGHRIPIRNLPEMLEGQVAALGSNVLRPTQKADLLDALFASALYRPDQDSFLLAPKRCLPAFIDKNVIGDDDLTGNQLLSALVSADERSIVARDVDGRVRFSPALSDERALTAALDQLGEDDAWRDLVGRHRVDTCELYDQVFEHKSFLGRSGAMYAYEGIGSIYWHMVTKLLVAVHDAASTAAASGAAPDVVDRLVRGYDRVRAGLGFNKTASEFGAVPLDPYSHTPAHTGAQQPGMTGAVKEELLTRPSELGIRVRDGEIVFDSLLLRQSELLDHPAPWTVVTQRGDSLVVDLEAGSLGLTVCQTPVVVSLADGEPSIKVDFEDGRTVRLAGERLGREVSAMLFGRTGEVRCIRASILGSSGQAAARGSGQVSTTPRSAEVCSQGAR